MGDTKGRRNLNELDIVLIENFKKKLIYQDDLYDYKFIKSPIRERFLGTNKLKYDPEFTPSS